MTPVPITPAVNLSDLTALGRRGGVRLERGRWQGRAVFVKSLETDDPEVRVRFHHEGRVTCRLNHPALVPLLAHTGEQLLFPFIEGCSLRELIDRRRLSVAETLAVVGGVLEAASYFHAQGVVHQDLKPENVLLVDGQASRESVRITDFGMAHDERLHEDLDAGTRMGTPQFMAPEQFRGVRGDPRSDVYAVGGLLFDCLAGEPPHPDALGWLLGLSSERLPLPGPAALHPLIERALSRDPAQRPQSAEQMHWALRAAAPSTGCGRPQPTQETPA